MVAISLVSVWFWFVIFLKMASLLLSEEAFARLFAEWLGQQCDGQSAEAAAALHKKHAVAMTTGADDAFRTARPCGRVGVTWSAVASLREPGIGTKGNCSLSLSDLEKQ